MISITKPDVSYEEAKAIYDKLKNNPESISPESVKNFLKRARPFSNIQNLESIFIEIQKLYEIGALLHEAKKLKADLNTHPENIDCYAIENFLQRTRPFPHSPHLKSSLSELNDLYEIAINPNETALIRLANSLYCKLQTNPQSAIFDIENLLTKAKNFKMSLNLNFVMNRLKQAFDEHLTNAQKHTAPSPFTEDLFSYITDFLPAEDRYALSMVSTSMLNLCDAEKIRHLNQGASLKKLRIDTENQLISLLQRANNGVLTLHLDIPIQHISTILSLCPRIQKLHIKNIQRPDHIDLIHQIARHPNSSTLRELHLQALNGPFTRNSQAVSTFPDFLSLSNLETLSLDGMDIGPDGAQSLAVSYLPNLKVLNLTFNYIGNTGIDLLAKASYFSQLEVLNLSGGTNRITAEGVQAITTSCSNLKKLMFYYNCIGDEGAELIANAPALSKLISLDISCTETGIRGALAIAHSPYLSNLQEINLYGNHITDDGAAAIMTSSLPNLKEVNLANNNLSSRVMEKNAFMTSKLSNINLSYNQVDSEGVKKLGDILSQFPHLTFLSLQYNKIGPSGAQSLTHAFYRSTGLTIDFCGNSILWSLEENQACKALRERGITIIRKYN